MAELYPHFLMSIRRKERSVILAFGLIEQLLCIRASNVLARTLLAYASGDENWARVRPVCIRLHSSYNTSILHTSCGY
jgi:hypothetical protein